MKPDKIKIIFCCLCLMSSLFLFAQSNDTTTITVKKTNDFEVTGDGSSANWNNTNWITLV